MYEKKRVYITVKTYPTISTEYAELVCTAGILENGSWIRLYPLSFRMLEDEKKFHKYTWITVDAEKNTSDFRPESYRPNIDTIQVEPAAGNKKTPWDERRRIILDSQNIYTNMQNLIDAAKSDERKSLAVFKPTEILGFVIKPTSREWDSEKIEALYNQSQQLNLMQSIEEIENQFRVAQKIPYKFSYRFKDDCGTIHTLMIEDWEIGMLYLHCLDKANKNESQAVEKVKSKYLGEFAQRDIYFFLGTTKAHHFRSVNPFVIIGVFPPPFSSENQQLSLFDD